MVPWYVTTFTWSALTSPFLRTLINSAGIPFMDTVNFHLGIAEEGQAILGDYLLGLQVGNEPDLYVRHKRRPPVSQTRTYILTLQQLRDFINRPINP
jgi:hypothetical protein